ncbi:MAG TPA: alpha/beta hydrolase [Mycobacteriales bacterium]|nr:alpha/beta hydrolase [Mycobacteriales bacterium]
MLRAVLVGACLLLLLVALLWALQRRLVFLPDRGPVPPAATALPGADDVTLTTSDGLALGAWHLPAEPGRPTVLVTPGNAGSRSARVPLAEALSVHGLGVLLLDYRGYGGNDGAPSEDGLRRDARAGRAFLVDEAGVDPDRLVYLGESLGAAVAADLATEHPPAALVLRSPFTSLADVGQVHYPFLPVRALLRDRFDVEAAVRQVDVPLVVVLGTRDGIVPPGQSRAVARAAAGPSRLVEVDGADHNDPVLLSGAELVGAVLQAAGGG